MRLVLARWPTVLAALSPIACAMGCDDDPARVQLVQVNATTCGIPSGARNIRVTAFARSGEERRALGADESITIDNFPPDTEQIGVAVEIGGGAVGAVGKTAPLDFLELDQGARIPIFMAPLDGMCPTLAPMSVPRVAPLAARAGNGVLVVGGHDGTGSALASAEFYDPMTGTFSPVEVPSVLTQSVEGFLGATLTPLPDGRVVLSGGARAPLTVFDPATMAFDVPRLIDDRAFHAAIAIGGGRLLVAGGCSTVVAGACAGLERLSSFNYSITDTSDSTPGPTLRAARIGATLFDLGRQLDGSHAYVMAGGIPRAAVGAEQADRLAVDDTTGTALDGQLLDGVRAHAAQLDGGAVLTAFAVDGAPAVGTAAVIAPGTATARPIAAAPARTGVRLIALEDGRVLGVGGAANAEVLVYDPTTDRWSMSMPAGQPPAGALAAPTLTRLADGSVLVLGGTLDGAATADAWIYRPSLVGPSSGAVTFVPAGTPGTLTAADPAAVSRGEAWELTGTDVPVHAIIGGPRMATGNISATVRIHEGGVGLIAQQTGPGRALVGEIVPGQAARIVRLDGTARHILCSGEDIAPRGPEVAANVRLDVLSDAVRLTLDGAVVASCPPDSAERGAWGVAALAGSRIAVGTATVDRR